MATVKRPVRAEPGKRYASKVIEPSGSARIGGVDMPSFVAPGGGGVVPPLMERTLGMIGRSGQFAAGLQKPPVLDIPTPTFLQPRGGLGGGPEDALLEDLSKQLSGLGYQELARQRARTIGAAERGIVATGQELGRLRSDIARQIADMKRQTVQAQAGTEAGLAARGISGQGVAAGKVADVGAEGERAVTGAERVLSRGELEARERVADIKRSRRETLEDLDAAKQERQLHEEAAAAEAKATARAQAAQARRGEASSWMRARANELASSGLDEPTARSVALAEARQFYTEVPETFLAGTFPPPGKPRLHPTRREYGLEISPRRAAQLSQAKVKEIVGLARRPDHPVGFFAEGVRRYQSQAGDSGTMEGFLAFLEDAAISRRLPGAANEREWRNTARKYANALSYLGSQGGWA